MLLSVALKGAVYEMNENSSNGFYYVFLDEGGNFDFSTKGTSFFTITAITLTAPAVFDHAFSSLKYEFIKGGLDIEYFHASEDKQAVRDRVFKVISDNMSGRSINSIIVEKAKTMPSLHEEVRFYPKIMGYLLQYMLRDLGNYDGLVVITDRLPVKKRRRAIEKAINTSLSVMMKPVGKPYKIMHHSSKSSFCLQVADYCNWAIFRKWERGDFRSYNLIRQHIRSEFDVFSVGDKHYY